jgi:hypothetical protein
MFKLTSLIPPSIGINLIRKNIEKSLKRKVEDFSIIYMSNKDKLQIKIADEKELFYLENDVLIPLIKSKASEYLSKTQTLDAVSLNVNKESKIEAKLFYTENGQKQFINYKL